MTIHIGVGGAWKEFDPGTAVGVGGANKAIETIHIGVGGAWKLAHQAVSVNFSDFTVTHNNPGGLASAGIVFGSDGRLYKYTGGTLTEVVGQWLDSPGTGRGANYQIRCASISSGNWDFSAASTGVYARANVDLTWRVLVTAKASPDASVIDSIFDIQPYGGGAVIDSSAVHAEAFN